MWQEERGKERAGVLGSSGQLVSLVLALPVSRWGLGHQSRLLCPLPLASLPAQATFRASSGVVVPVIPGRKEAKLVGGGSRKETECLQQSCLGDRAERK